MKLNYNYSLVKLNTFKINSIAKTFFEYINIDSIKYLLDEKILPSENKLILGGGSNLLFLSDFDGIVIQPINDNIDLVFEDENYIYIKAGAGLNWDTFVKYCVSKGWGGIENLSNIPGNVGASPVQNIGAYGVEAKDIIHEVNIVSLVDASTKTLSNIECEFAYRKSIFKTKLKDDYLVDSVVYKLDKAPKLITHYGSLKNELEKLDSPNIKDLREVIIKTRSEKLPSPDEIGNGGSFFKNPVIEKSLAIELLNKFPNMVTYLVNENETKVAAGWLIDNCGLKGYVNENKTAGIHNKQALVIVNKGNATGKDIVEVAEYVQKTVFEKYGIQLEPEVLYI